LPKWFLIESVSILSYYSQLENSRVKISIRKLPQALRRNGIDGLYVLIIKTIVLIEKMDVFKLISQRKRGLET
jgi:hypothetical protein